MNSSMILLKARTLPMVIKMNIGLRTTMLFLLLLRFRVTTMTFHYRNWRKDKVFSVQTSNYAIKVGMDIDVYLTGRKDWSEFVDAISIAFQEKKIQNDMFTAFVEADNKLPAQDKFVITDDLTKENKSKFDELIEDVEGANGGASAVILGLKSDLQKLERLQDVDWIADSQKEERARLGRLGSYGVNTLVEIPQRFVKNDVTKETY